MACKDKHDLGVGLIWRRVYEISGGDWEKHGGAWIPHVFAYNLSIACNHCAKPVCKDVCPTTAITKCMCYRYREWGFDLLFQDVCINSHYLFTYQPANQVAVCSLVSGNLHNLCAC